MIVRRFIDVVLVQRSHVSLCFSWVYFGSQGDASVLVPCTLLNIRYSAAPADSVSLQFGDAVPNAVTGGTDYVISSGTNSLITSILSAGTFVGALMAYPVGDFGAFRNQLRKPPSRY